LAGSTSRKRLIRPVPLTLGYALSRMRPLHALLPDRVRYKLPLSWNFEMLRSFLRYRRDRFYIDIATELHDPPSFAPRVEAPAPHALTPEQIRSFYDNGYLGPFTLVPREQMLTRVQRMWDLWDAPSATYPPGTFRYAGDTATSKRPDEMSNEEYVRRFLNARDKHLQDLELLDLLTHPGVTDRVAQLLGPDLLLWRTQFFPKYAGMGGTGWHQASSYLNETMRVATLSPPDLTRLFQLTVWIAVNDSTPDNGCLRVVRGTQRRILPMALEDYDAAKHEANKSERFGTMVMRPADPLPEADVVDLPMQAGQFVIFSERVMHGSRANVTASDDRLAVNGRYIAPETAIHNPWVLGEGGLDIAYGRIEGLRLERWRAVLARGEDRVGANPGRVVPLDEVRRSLGAAADAA
jgi:non-haem Fe2+, alpha-ketoglutarate-dependent halogenase